MRNKKYHTVGTFPRSNRKIVERGRIDTPNTHIHDLSPLWLCLRTDTSSKSNRVKLKPYAALKLDNTLIS